MGRGQCKKSLRLALGPLRDVRSDDVSGGELDMNRILAGVAAAVVLACGPDVSRDDDAGQEAGDEESPACADGACPEELSCGERGNVCIGGFGIAPCVDGECGPAPGACFGEYLGLVTCDELCDHSGAECVARACEGVTAYSYRGSPSSADALRGICGKNTEEVLAGVEEHTFDCGDPLPWSDDVAMMQCCCDDPRN